MAILEQFEIIEKTIWIDMYTYLIRIIEIIIIIIIIIIIVMIYCRVSNKVRFFIYNIYTINQI